MKKLKILFTTLIGLIGLFIGGGMINVDLENMIESFMIQTNSQPVKELGEIKIDEIKSIIKLNGNYANFTLEELESTEPWQTFSDLDSLNRVGVADALLHKSMLSSEPREDISIIITMNLEFERWEETFKDSILTAAIDLSGSSFRVENTKQWLR